MRVPRTALVFAVASLGAAAALVWTLAHRPFRGNEKRSALRYIPDGAMVIASARLDELRGSPLVAPLLDAQAKGELTGLGPLTTVCGFDPLRAIEEIALAVPEAGDDPDLGIVAVGSLDARALSACGVRVIESRGKTAVVEHRDGFTIVSDADRKRSGRIAVRDGGPLFLGGGDYFEAMMRSATMTAPDPFANHAHFVLRGELGQANPRGAVVVTAILSERIRKRAEAELTGAGAELSHVTSLATSLALAPDLRLEATLACDTPAACRTLEGVGGALQANISKTLPTVRPGLAELFDHAQLRVADRELHARVELQPEQAARVFDAIESMANETTDVGPESTKRGR